MLKSRKSSKSSKNKKKKSKKIRKYWDVSSSDYASCSDSEECEGGGNAILAYIILAVIGIVILCCICYCLIKLAR